MAFRTLDLPPTRGAARSSKPTASAKSSRRSSLVLEADATAKSRPVRNLLRRLSSFSKKKDKGEKLTVPDVSTMPVVDMDKLKQLSEAEDAKAEVAANGLGDEVASEETSAVTGANGDVKASRDSLPP